MGLRAAGTPNVGGRFRTPEKLAPLIWNDLVKE
jgi:hypothetical protein